MLFIHPMWDCEDERLGMKACTPFGYALREIADGIGFIGLILLVAVPVYIAYRVCAHQFLWKTCWLFLIPFTLGVIGRVLYEISWRLARKKRLRLF
jgi:hypothetical protein